MLRGERPNLEISFSISRFFSWCLNGRGKCEKILFSDAFRRWHGTTENTERGNCRWHGNWRNAFIFRTRSLRRRWKQNKKRQVRDENGGQRWLGIMIIVTRHSRSLRKTLITCKFSLKREKKWRWAGRYVRRRNQNYLKERVYIKNDAIFEPTAQKNLANDVRVEYEGS